MGNASQRLGAPLQRHAQLQGRRQNVQRIIYHKSARNANPNFYPLCFRHGGERHMVRAQLDILRPQVGVRLLRVGEFLAVRVLHQPGRPRVVRVVNAHGAVSE